MLASIGLIALAMLIAPPLARRMDQRAGWVLALGRLYPVAFKPGAARLHPASAWLALAAGVVADLYFWGIIGIYTFILPALSAFGRWYARVFPELFVFRLLGNIVAITVSCLYTWLVFRLIGWTDLTLKAIGFSLLYTAGWTTGISLATYWLWAKLARSYPFLVDLDNYRY